MLWSAIIADILAFITGVILLKTEFKHIENGTKESFGVKETIEMIKSRIFSNKKRVMN